MIHAARLLPALVLALPLLLGACASTRTPSPASAPPVELFSDASFKPPSQKIDASRLFTLSAAMQAYLNSPAFALQLRRKGAQRGLIDALYEKGELKLEYDASVTRNAAETFEARMGNCLSLVLMTAAFAKELGLEVHYNDVVSDDVWTRTGNLYFGSAHVNLSLAKREIFSARGSLDEGPLLIDFVPSRDAARSRSTPLTEREITARYLNNRAAEALAAQRLDDAYWWARAALVELPNFTMAQNTLGVIYQNAGHFALAERAFKHVLTQERDHVVAMQNLVPVLGELGKEAEARALKTRLAVLEPIPPFHWFHRGMAAYRQGLYREAKSLFAREVARAPYNDEFHFWLAVSHWQLGDMSKAREQLGLALENSTTDDATRRYSAKLASLQARSAARETAY